MKASKFNCPILDVVENENADDCVICERLLSKLCSIVIERGIRVVAKNGDSKDAEGGKWNCLSATEGSSGKLFRKCSAEYFRRIKEEVR